MIYKINRILDLRGSFKARYAWQLPLGGFGASVAVNFLLRAGGMHGGLAMGLIGVGIMGVGMIGGVIGTVLGFLKEAPRGKISNKIHSVVGILVNGFLLLMIIGGLMRAKL